MLTFLNETSIFNQVETRSARFHTGLWFRQLFRLINKRPLIKDVSSVKPGNLRVWLRDVTIFYHLQYLTIFYFLIFPVSLIFRRRGKPSKQIPRVTMIPRSRMREKWVNYLNERKGGHRSVSKHLSKTSSECIERVLTDNDDTSRAQPNWKNIKTRATSSLSWMSFWLVAHGCRPKLGMHVR